MSQSTRGQESFLASCRPLRLCACLLMPNPPDSRSAKSQLNSCINILRSPTLAVKQIPDDARLFLGTGRQSYTLVVCGFTACVRWRPSAALRPGSDLSPDACHLSLLPDTDSRGWTRIPQPGHRPEQIAFIAWRADSRRQRRVGCTRLQPNVYSLISTADERR
jgi:hypothetical protein